MSEVVASDGTALYEMTWEPAQTPRASTILVHGYGEHIGRYGHVAQALTDAGFTVRGYDQRGHGRSGGRRGFCQRFSEYTSDLGLVVERAAQALPDRPVFIIAHSFGALVTATWLSDQPRDKAPWRVSGWVASAPYFRIKLEVPRIKVLAGKLMSRIYPQLALPTGIRGTDVSRDPEIAAAYETDPLNNKNATARWFTEANQAQEALLQRASEIRVDTLVLVAQSDRIADPKRGHEIANRIGAPNKSVHLLDGQFHEIFNEPLSDRKRTLDLMLSWLADRVQAAAGPLRAHGP